MALVDKPFNAYHFNVPPTEGVAVSGDATWFWQYVRGVVIPGETGALTVREDKLVEPVWDGVVATTRIRYPVPAAVDEGIVALIVPDFALDNVPIATGFVGNTPVASESCAVNVFPAAKEADTV